MGSQYCQSVLHKMVGKHVQKGSGVMQMHLMWASVLFCHHWKTNSTTAPDCLITPPDTMKRN